jgi:hypothetical protein
MMARVMMIVALGVVAVSAFGPLFSATGTPMF